MKLEKVDDKTAYENLLVKYAELERENAELKEQIEKMKCCRNCKHPSTPVDNTCCDCEKYSKWELRR